MTFFPRLSHGSVYRPAHIECDNCGKIEKCRARRGYFGKPAYVAKGCPKPGWGMSRDRYGDREDYCPDCYASMCFDLSTRAGL